MAEMSRAPPSARSGSPEHFSPVFSAGRGHTSPKKRRRSVLPSTAVSRNACIRRQDHPVLDPYGTPIPDQAGNLRQQPGATLAGHKCGVPLRITRVDEQDRSLLERFHALGLTPGTTVQITGIDHPTGVLTISTADHETRIGLTMSDRIYASSLLPEYKTRASAM